MTRQNQSREITPPRETVLLAVTGMSPAVLTETIWALAREKPATIPDRVIAITTTSGRACIERELFTPVPEFGNKTVWDALKEALARNHRALGRKLRFGTTGDDIRVFTMADPKSGRSGELADISTPEENAAAADFILEQVRGIVEKPDTRLIASIAGGRKTMSALLYASLSLLGRPEDRLTHVLVNEPFDNPALRPKFYFPVRGLTHRLSDRAGKLVSGHPSSAARLQLAQVPFVTLRNLFERDMARKPGSFTAVVERARFKMSELTRRDCKLVIRRRVPEIIVNGVPVKISPAQYIILLTLAERATQGLAPLPGYKEAREVLRARARTLNSESTDAFDWRNEIKPDAIDPEKDKTFGRWATRHLSDLRAKLKKMGSGCAVLIPLLPQSGRFSLDLDPASIQFEQ